MLINTLKTSFPTYDNDNSENISNDVPDKIVDEGISDTQSDNNKSNSDASDPKKWLIKVVSNMVWDFCCLYGDRSSKLDCLLKEGDMYR